MHYNGLIILSDNVDSAHFLILVHRQFWGFYLTFDAPMFFSPTGVILGPKHIRIAF